MKWAFLREDCHGYGRRHRPSSASVACWTNSHSKGSPLPAQPWLTSPRRPLAGLLFVCGVDRALHGFLRRKVARPLSTCVRQSSAAHVEHNRESTDRQYALAAKPVNLAGPTIASSSSMRTSGSPVPALLRDRASPASPPKSHSPRRPCARTRGLAPGAQQRRLALPHRPRRPSSMIASCSGSRTP